jgi:hypothetical protein
MRAQHLDTPPLFHLCVPYARGEQRSRQVIRQEYGPQQVQSVAPLIRPAAPVPPQVDLFGFD